MPDIRKGVKFRIIPHGPAALALRISCNESGRQGRRVGDGEAELFEGCDQILMRFASSSATLRSVRVLTIL